MYCKGCGFALGDPEEDLHDPEGLSDVAQDLGIAPENEDAHLIVRDGEKGWRYYCSELGQVTSIVGEPPGEDKGDRKGEGAPPKEDSEPTERGRPKEIYDLPEDKSPTEVLAEVVTSPFLGLNEDQIDEVRDWAEDYNGQIPPDMLESILGNMSGVQKQAAALARQKYEVKLNKWVQEQAQGDEGPPIGVTAQPPKRERSSRGGTRGEGGGSATEPQPPPEGRNGSQSDRLPDDLSRYRRVRRTRRRNNAADIAVEEAAKNIAQEMSGEMAQNFGRYFSLPAKILEAKAEKDPDWFFEKLEQWDIDIDDILEPSESRKQEMREQSPSSVDMEADEALEQTQSETTEDDFFDEEPEEDQLEEDDMGLFEDEVEAAPGGD